MKKDLTDKVIVITGASSGIGAATAHLAAEAGMDVVLAARREERLAEVAGHVRKVGRNALVVPCDVTDDQQVDHLVAKTLDEFARLDVMFANAGYGFMAPFQTMDLQQERHIWEVNYFGCERCVRAAIAPMRRQGGGHILITSSIVGRIGLPFYTAYSATKSAQDALAMGLRLELEDDGIDVSVIYPIGTKTEFFKVSAELGGRDTISENTPQSLMQTPEQVARRIVGCLRKPCMEVWPARWSRYGANLGLMLPRLTRRALRRHAQHDRKELGLD